MAEGLQALIGIVITAFMGAMGEYARRKKKEKQQSRDTAIDTLVQRNEALSSSVGQLKTQIETMQSEHEEKLEHQGNQYSRLQTEFTTLRDNLGSTTNELSETRQKLLVEYETTRDLKTLLTDIEEQRDSTIEMLNEAQKRTAVAEAKILGMTTVLEHLQITVTVDTQEIIVNTPKSVTIEEPDEGK